MRLQRNCSSVTEFQAQADIIVDRFKEKGYKEAHLAKLKDEVLNMDRNNMLSLNKKNKNSKTDVAFITGFNSQYKDFEHIIKKYWPILQEDHALTKVLGKKPSSIYRRAPSLRHYLVHNVLDPPRTTSLCPELKGFFKCQRCLACRGVKNNPERKQALNQEMTSKNTKSRS